MTERPFTGVIEALPAEEAAAFCGMGRVAFMKRVRDGRAPGPVRIGAIERWPTHTLEQYRWGAQPGCALYLLGTNGSDFIKIGIAKDVRARVNTLQTGSPFELIPILTLPGSRKLESRFHTALRAERVRGEWFRVGPWFDEVTAWGSRPERNQVFDWLKARRA